MLIRYALLAFTIYFHSLVKSQFVASLPQCIQDCIDQSEDDNCSVTDIKCLCRASAGNFLPDLITCMHGNCDNNLDNNLLLTPLQFACEIAGTPIPDSAIQNAENGGDNSQATKTVTVGGSPATGGGSDPTITMDVKPSSVSTVIVTRTQGGSIVVIAYPVTEWRTTTVSGSGSTITSMSKGSAGVRTYTITDSKGQTTIQTSTLTEIMTSSSPISTTGSDSTMIVATSLAAAKTSSSQISSSKTTTAPSEDETNSSPFKDTNSAVRQTVGNWLGLSILLIMGTLWF